MDQVVRLIEAAKQDQNWQVYAFIVIGLETSMRRMEILSIRLEHIDACYLHPKGQSGSSGTADRRAPGGVSKRLYRCSGTGSRVAVPFSVWGGSYEMD
jgi:integrase